MALSSSSFQNLPKPLILVILSYVSDPETICSLEAVCQDFRAVIVQNSDAIWERLHQERWKIFAPSNNILRTKAEYRRRHELDASAIQCIGRILQQESPSSSSSSSPTSNHHHHNHLILLHAVMTHILTPGKYVLDACWKVWRTSATCTAKNNEELIIIARDLVHLLHCYTVCEDLVGLLSDADTTTTTTTTTTRRMENSDALHLEECAILTSKIFYPLDKEDVDTMGYNSKSQWIRNEFDRIADMVRREHNSAGGGFDDAQEMNIAQRIRAVHKILFGEGDDDEFCLAFTGNVENYYECDNSLLHVALERRKAIPMTLAIIYKCVCRRLGIHVDIIGLPGHIVVHVPELGQYYVDVFHSGRLLTRQDCGQIVNSFGFAMQESYLQPLSTQLVVCRVLKNMENCLERRENHVGSRGRGGNVIRRAYLTTALQTLSSSENNDAVKLESCRRLLSHAWVTERRRLEDQDLP